MRVLIEPEPQRDVGEAIRRAVARRPSPQPPAYRSRWRLAGLDYATARPRNSPGATRA